MTTRDIVEAMPEESRNPDEERISLHGHDPEDVLRALLKVNPEATPAAESALARIATASADELATPERRDALIQDALEAGATREQVDGALDAPR